MMMMAYRQEHQRTKVSFSFSSNWVAHIQLHAPLSWFCFLLFSALVHLQITYTALRELFICYLWSRFGKLPVLVRSSTLKQSCSSKPFGFLPLTELTVDRRLRLFFSINWTINSFRDWIAPWFNNLRSGSIFVSLCEYHPDSVGVRLTLNL